MYYMMETYQVRRKVTDRTLTVELPEEFAGSEVEVKVVILQNSTSDDTEEKKIDKWEALRRAKGMVKPPFYEPTEDEWYQQ